MKWQFNELIIAAVLSYIAVTILNYLVHIAFPQIGILKTGIAFILILVGIVLVMLFTFVKDGKLTMDEAKAMLIIIAIMVGLYFVIKHFLPELFSIVPDSLKQVFGALGI